MTCGGFRPISNMSDSSFAMVTFPIKTSRIAQWVHLFLINFNDIPSFLLCFSKKCPLHSTVGVWGFDCAVVTLATNRKRKRYLHRYISLSGTFSGGWAHLYQLSGDCPYLFFYLYQKYRLIIYQFDVC